VFSERREEKIFSDMLNICPGLLDRLLAASEEEVEFIADLVRTVAKHDPISTNFGSGQIQKGINGARSDDTKTMKSAIIDWITPPGQNLSPPLSHKVKTTRGFHHERTGALLCPAGVDWSIPQYAPALSIAHPKLTTR
jgi:hypothetical protein